MEENRNFPWRLYGRLYKRTFHNYKSSDKFTSVPGYELKDYNEEEIVVSFFQDELIHYNPSELYESEMMKQRKT